MSEKRVPWGWSLIVVMLVDNLWVIDVMLVDNPLVIDCCHAG